MNLMTAMSMSMRIMTMNMKSIYKLIKSIWNALEDEVCSSCGNTEFHYYDNSKRAVCKNCKAELV